MGHALGDDMAQIDDKYDRADEIQRMFNEWILENKENLFREFMKGREVKTEL